MAAVSHLPHVLANVLVAQAAGRSAGDRMPATGPSFRDATRVAGANPALWTGIYRSNREALRAALDVSISRPAGRARGLDADDGAALLGLAERGRGQPPRAARGRPGRRRRAASCAPPCPTGPASSPISR